MGILILILHLVSWSETTPSQTCDAGPNFTKTWSFLSQDKELSLSSTSLTSLALEVSQGCQNSFTRFSKVYTVLKNAGVSLKKALEISLQFAKDDDGRADNFIEVFKAGYLEKSLDMDFASTLHISMEISKVSKENLKTAGQDFVTLAKYCVDNKGLSLPLAICTAEILKIVPYSPLFPKGLNKDFITSVTYFRSHKALGFTIQEAFSTTREILSHGPTAFDNFQKTFEFALGSDMQLSAKSAVTLAMKVVKQSMSLQPQPSPEIKKNVVQN